ncbi:MAG: SET domain-containing protein-lysine N-methyltransferase, partial [archaeon]|nr:SET domain-containing protein-lysine N-methyltransferase [archaeon]
MVDDDPIALLRHFREELVKIHLPLDLLIIKHIIYQHSKGGDIPYLLSYYPYTIQGHSSWNVNPIFDNISDLQESSKNYHHLKIKKEPSVVQIKKSSSKEKSLKEHSHSKSKINLEHKRIFIEKLSNLISVEWPQKDGYKNTFLSESFLSSMDAILFKCKMHYYTSNADIVYDLSYLCETILRKLEKLIPKKYSSFLDVYKVYLSIVYLRMKSDIEKLKFMEKYEDDIQRMLDANKLPKVKHSNLGIPAKKEYITLEEYEHINIDDTKDKIETSFTMDCSTTCCCCNDIKKLGPLDLSTTQWNSECPARKHRIECTENCKCDLNTCKNCPIRKKEYKELGKDVEERYSWGIDLFTYRNILTLCPNNFEDENFDGNNTSLKDFVEKSLVIALSKCGTSGGDISEGCKYIMDCYNLKYNIYKENEDNLSYELKEIKKTKKKTTLIINAKLPENPKYPQMKTYYSDTLSIINNKTEITQNREIKTGEVFLEKDKKSIHPFSELDYHLAKLLYKKIKVSPLSQEKINHAYSKGIGIFCIKKEGIKQNELVAPYLGQIYSPYAWYEKQDMIKQRKLDKNLPDFYNIWMERFLDDEDGYNLVMIDPNWKGNFTSRMSHSCNPNCNTVEMVSQGKYAIGMFAMRDINLNEELTFDYNSVTEKKEEFYESICLCSTYFCRGHYISFYHDFIYTQIINLFHTFLHRNALLLLASISKGDSLNKEEKELLDKNHIKDSLLKDAPYWLQKWCFYIVRFIDIEEELLKRILYKAKTGEERRTLREEKFKERLDSSAKKTKQFNGANHKAPIKYNFAEEFVWNKKCYRSEVKPIPEGYQFRLLDLDKRFGNEEEQNSPENEKTLKEELNPSLPNSHVVRLILGDSEENGNSHQNPQSEEENKNIENEIEMKEENKEEVEIKKENKEEIKEEG